ncbi:inositol monophosphatase family protein [uncultured Helicobacter sp.]|uniref:inositol monophosphatase family protein n=1 Tax=uncultured Helicobacter sp. TaxID=175537 RepID=UPI00374F43DB
MNVAPFTPFLTRCIEAAREIIALLDSGDSALYVKHTQGAGGDVSIGADLECQRIFAKHLLPLAHIDSEESGFIPSPHSTDDIIILDPLDGSDNFLSHIPYYGASVALCNRDRICKEAVVIHFCTQRLIARSGDRIFALSLGDFHRDSISLDSHTFTCANTPKCGIFEKAYSNPHIASLFFANGLKFRSLGASALSIALAHKVSFMLFAGSIREYDSKAGLFLCEGLHINHSRDFLLISKDKQIFDTIMQLLTQGKD